MAGQETDFFGNCRCLRTHIHEIHVPYMNEHTVVNILEVSFHQHELVCSLSSSKDISTITYILDCNFDAYRTIPG